MAGVSSGLRYNRKRKQIINFFALWKIQFEIEFRIYSSDFNLFSFASRPVTFFGSIYILIRDDLFQTLL